jgi:hypothetical protein
LIQDTLQDYGENSVAVGVDPVSGGTHRMTSDDYFFNNSLTEKRMFDLIFIDGDHRSEQVILDVFNSLRILTEAGTIVMHDTNARHKRTVANDPTSFGGREDVWKTIPIIRLQDGLEIVTIDINHGVSVIRRRKNENRLPVELEKKILLPENGNALEAITFEDFDKYYRDTILRLVCLQEFKIWIDQEENEVISSTDNNLPILP